ncbi:MAG: hypothetical protein JXA57_19705 [Armatimonadetes bacterium]|nr:hypothetical protein [Armatimonadota bacterium]
MARGSRRFTELKRRLVELRGHLLSFLPPTPGSKTGYTSRELDLTRSYVVLVHAEIEAYCEDLVMEMVKKARHQYDSQKNVTPVLRRIIAYYVGKKDRSWSDCRTPSGDVVYQAFTSYMERIRSNHGIKRENLEKLLYPLGVSEPALSTTWLAQMDSFGSDRGGWAHKSIKALNPPDPASELAKVSQLLQGLLDLDRMVVRMR